MLKRTKLSVEKNRKKVAEYGEVMYTNGVVLTKSVGLCQTSIYE